MSRLEWLWTPSTLEPRLMDAPSNKRPRPEDDALGAKPLESRLEALEAQLSAEREARLASEKSRDALEARVAALETARERDGAVWRR